MQGITMLNTHCTEVGCEETAQGRCYKSELYCAKHYEEHIDSELFSTFSGWVEGEDPPERFKYMLGRASDEQKWLCSEGFLSMARVRDRTYAFKKTATGCNFQITRHPGGHDIYDPNRRIVQTWEANLTSKILTLLGTRPWQEGDPDPQFEDR